MASKSITVLKTETDVLIATNGARAITAALHNVLLNDILDSSLNRISDAALIGLNDFDSSATYPEGRAVMYDDGGGVDIYRSNTANGPAAFDPLEWDVISGGGGGATNLTWTAATRTVASDTGTDAIISLFTSTDAGLTPSSGGGATNFLRADGTWEAPSVNSIYTADDTLTGERYLNSGGYDLILGDATGDMILNASRDFRINNSGSFLGGSSKIRSFGGDIILTSYSINAYGGTTTEFLIREGIGFSFSDVTNGLGLSYDDYTVDEANVGAWGTEDNHIPSEARIIANVGVVAITNDYIPIGNSGVTGIEDSNLIST
jgi:hypothetical protein